MILDKRRNGGLHLLLLMLAASLPIAGCKAALTASWPSDCVGRMQISLPEVADVATVTADSIVRSATSGNLAESYFADGREAPHSAIVYFGPVDATGSLTDKEIASLRTRLALETTLVKRTIEKRKNAGEEVSFAVLPTPGWDGIVWDFGNRIRGRLFVGRQYYAWGVSMQSEHKSHMQSTFKSLMAGLVPRKNFSVPVGNGVCMPNFFVRDAGTVNRNVTTSYRLPSHPDVVIIFQDASAPQVTDIQNPNKFTVKARTNFFWTQLEQSPRSRETLSNETVTFAGQKGLETKLKLVRDDGSDDYGYSVFTRGDPHATQDTPGLMLVLIRNAADAKAKGRMPISEDEFFKLAKSVAASVKARPAVKQIDK